MPFEPGTRLGHYEIQSAIGAGSMGEVYRARDTRLKRDVALKIRCVHRGIGDRRDGGEVRRPALCLGEPRA